MNIPHDIEMCPWCNAVITDYPDDLGKCRRCGASEIPETSLDNAESNVVLFPGVDPEEIALGWWMPVATRRDLRSR